MSDPAAIHIAIAASVPEGWTVVVTGSLDRRLVFIENASQLPGVATSDIAGRDLGRDVDGDAAASGRWLVADLSGRSHDSRVWPSWTAGNLDLAEPGSWLSAAALTRQARERLLRPRVLLAALYHPEHFPLPRFPLAISDLARAARSTLMGQVELMDMQLGASVEDVIRRACSGEVDVLGVSMTFGQHDLALRLLDAVYATPATGEDSRVPLVIAGGSLSARNERILLERYPRLLIGRAAGEPTMADLLAYWHGDLGHDRIRGIGYLANNGQASAAGGTPGPASCGTAAGSVPGPVSGQVVIDLRPRHTVSVANRAQPDIWPELDLLPATLEQGGVAQLETSRGCTNFCSFCPRGHKGMWSGAAPDALPWIVQEMAAVFDQHPGLARVLYLVDEEFIGRGPDAVPRALAVAAILHAAGFSWETSCRVDQVALGEPGSTDPKNLSERRDWHVERARMWRALVEKGLRRCLFGVESGVSSILERFTKETTSEQNALAIRTLTALGVPPRFTYITFDHLMNADELRATVAFQARTDLLIAAQPGLPVEEIVDGVRDEAWVAQHATGQPFYTGISYMLVGMECLIGAAYTRRVQDAGLAGAPDPAMGRIDARYADWRIGVLARTAQLWIDRNFALDYTLKSLEKILDGPAYRQVRGLRRVLKRAAFQLLASLSAHVTGTPVVAPGTAETGRARTEFEAACARELTARLDELRHEFALPVAAVIRHLPAGHARLLEQEYQRWSIRDTWQLINAAAPCSA